MQVGQKIYLIDVCQEMNQENPFQVQKKAYMLNNEKVSVTIVKIIDSEDIIYKIGQCEHRGTIGYDCFLTKEEAAKRMEGLNNYFNK